MNSLDAAVLALLLLAVLLGWRSGALPQVAGLGGAVLGAAAGLAAVPWLLPYLTDLPAAVRAGAIILVLLGAVGIGEGLGTRLGRAASGLLGAGLLGAMDRVAGAVVGAGQAVLIVWLAGGILATGAIPGLGQLAQQSRAIRAVAVLLPSPTEIVLELGKALDESGLPDVFVGLERLPALPVELPDDPLAQAIGGRAAASVPRVQAEACTTRSTGTGFVIATGYVVTNAHVVAGAGTVRVDAGSVRDARVVLFDPELDVAVLYAPGSDLPALRFAVTSPDRGDVGAILGYPGGGALAVVPAAVTDRYVAIGRDIGGRSRVRREVLEVRAPIEQGDSGGPLVLEDGTVGGVVFAESRTTEDVGYALAPTAVATRVAPAVGRTAAVDPGACIP